MDLGLCLHPGLLSHPGFEEEGIAPVLKDWDA